MSGPSPASDPKPVASDVILQDYYTTGSGSTQIEVRSDSIRISGGDGPDREIPLSGGQDALDGISEEIRCQIARKIAVLVPTLADMQKAELFAYSLNVLKVLAKDQAVRVRRMVTEELKALPNAPKDVIDQLLNDTDSNVVLPILEYSPLLKDAELLEILMQSPVPGVAQAIAKRRRVSEPVADAIAHGDDREAIGVLLKNPNALLKESTILELVDRAGMEEHWYESILERPNLTLNTINHIGKFASASLLRQMQEKGLLDAQTSQALSDSLRSRLKSVKMDSIRSAELRATELQAAQRLTPEVVADALEKNDMDFVLSGMQCLTGITRETIQRIIKSQNASAVTALAWKSGLSMRAAIQVQMRMARIPPDEMLNAKNGTDYPISEQTMRDYLKHFTG